MALLFPMMLPAQTARIKGTISDSASRNAIPGASLRVDDRTSGTGTNALGQFQLCEIPSGTHTIKVSCIGYEAKTFTVTLEDNQKKTMTIVLNEKNTTLKEVTVQSGEADQSSLVINHIDRQLRPANSAQDLLTLVPGLFIAQHAGGGKAEQIFLRGFDCDHGTDFNVSVDGMPVNMVSHAHGQGYADFHFVIPETVDRLNAWKGPYYAAFGDFATAGAGQFFTKNSIDKNLIRVGYGDFNTQRVLAMVDLLHGEHLLSKQPESAYIAVDYNYADSYFESPQHFSRFNIFGKYTGRLNERNLLSFSASGFSSKWNASGQIPERAVEQGLITRFGSIDNSEGGTTGRNNVNLQLVTDAGHNSLIKNQIFYSYYRFNLFSNFTFFLNDSINGDEINQTEKGRNIYGYNGSYERNDALGTKNLKSVIGIGTRIDDSELSLRHAVQRVILDTIVAGRMQEQSIFSYLDETITLGNGWVVNGAVRVDHFNFGFDDRYADSITGNAARTRVSPKLNVYYNVTPAVQVFAHAGYGFHSNDARSVVQRLAGESLPKALGYEAGSTFKPTSSLIINAAVWGLNLENELVYVGDEGVVEINGATQRLGVDLALRWELTSWLLADVDFNYNHGRFIDLPEGENFIPLAPQMTSTGGLTVRQEKGFSAGLRYRHVGSRPANENNTVTAKGYFLLDALANYTMDRFAFGLSAENLLNAEWNQAQFDTESRLKNEAQPVDELHFTPGTPFFLKGSFTYYF